VWVGKKLVGKTAGSGRKSYLPPHITILITLLPGGSTPTPLLPLQCDWVSQSHLGGSGGSAMLELFWGPPSIPPFTPKSSVFLKLSPSFVVQVVHVPLHTQKKASGNSSTPTNQPEACTLHTCYFCEKEGTHTNSISWSSLKLSPSFVVQVAHVVSLERKRHLAICRCPPAGGVVLSYS
jgi:hypothetical protein